MGGHQQAGMNEKANGRRRQRERGKRETGIWGVTVNTHARHYHHTINIVRHKHRRRAMGAKIKAQKKSGGGGTGRWETMGVTGFPVSSDSEH